MADSWWQDLHDRNDRWQGLEITVAMPSPTPPGMMMHSGHHGRMALQVQAQTLFWGAMLRNHSGVWLVFNAHHPAQQGLLPPVTSRDITSLNAPGGQGGLQAWSRFFARHLMSAPGPLLPARRWLLAPMTAISSHRAGQPLAEWRFSSPASSANIGINWTLNGEDFPDLRQPKKIMLVDWWWGGDLLLARYPLPPQSGRLKWWRKKCREGTLPPVLVWHIAGFASYLILDGHYRLQAAIEEGIPPQFLVLSELKEQVWTPDAAQQARTMQALAKQQRDNPHCNIESINQTLIDLYDPRFLHAATSSRAVSGEGDTWARELGSYLRRHGMEEYLANIVNRVSGEA